MFFKLHWFISRIICQEACESFFVMYVCDLYVLYSCWWLNFKILSINSWCTYVGWNAEDMGPCYQAHRFVRWSDGSSQRSWRHEDEEAFHSVEEWASGGHQRIDRGQVVRHIFTITIILDSDLSIQQWEWDEIKCIIFGKLETSR